MKTCVSCRYFGPRNGVLVWDPEACDLVETEHRICERIEYASAQSHLAAVRRDPAIVTDVDGRGAHLRVLPTFGCCFHIPRNEA